MSTWKYSNAGWYGPWVIVDVRVRKPGYGLWQVNEALDDLTRYVRDAMP